jgi:hypothetical protein
MLHRNVDGNLKVHKALLARVQTLKYVIWLLFRQALLIMCILKRCRNSES